MKESNVEFKTLLSKTEYNKLCKQYTSCPSNLQINYYFDTPRFTLKASDIGLRIIKRDKYEINLKRKKGYQLQEIDEEVTEDVFKQFLKDGIIPSESIALELSEIIKGQNVINYMSLSTFRITFPYKNGTINIDKCDYVDTTDYELIFEGYNYDECKRNFIIFVKENGLVYKKSQPKIKRAYDALKRKI